jgi:hypothetical protein
MTILGSPYAGLDNQMRDFRFRGIFYRFGRLANGSKQNAISVDGKEPPLEVSARRF